MSKLNFAIFGLGRMGSVHLNNIISNNNANISFIFDTNKKKLNYFQKKYKLEVPKNINKDIFQNKNIDVVFISSPTNTHLELILKSIKYKKFIFCEKPIDLNLRKINKVRKLCESYKKTFQIGFNRRFDPTVANVIKKSKNGTVGNIEKLIITSRDRSPPPANYIKSSGGILRDCSIHDIDLMLNIFEKDRIKEVFCYASNLFDKNAKKYKDYDTIVSIFKTTKGKIAIINNSRHSSYGYDQRIEVFGNKGMLQTENIRHQNVNEFSNNSTSKGESYLNFFLERYSESFKIELDVFLNSIKKNKSSKVLFKDCRNALIICEALYNSIKNKKSVSISY